ncbi:HNH endonuclease [Methylobacterium fujisawaense]|jgi:intracellular multiplication protein IcmJ
MSSKQLLPIVLSCKTQGWRMHDPDSHEADHVFQTGRQRVLDVQKYTCQYCGFQSQKWQEIHHRNDDHHDNRPENLAVACMYCHMCFHIGLAGHKNEGVLIFLPEMEQADLNCLVRACQVARRAADLGASDAARPRPDQDAVREYRDAATAILKRLDDRRAKAEELLGGVRNPSDLANIMMLMPDDLYAQRHERLHGIRLLPTGVRKGNSGEDRMVEIVDFWLSTGGPFGARQPRTWMGTLKLYLGALPFLPQA